MANIFVSYVHTDREIVNRVYRKLQQGGFDLWMDRWNLRGGDQWTTEIVEAISECSIFLLFMSANSMASDSVQREVHIAYEEKKKIVILRLDETEIPIELKYQLARIHWIEMKTSNYMASLKSALEDKSPSLPFAPSIILPTIPTTPKRLHILFVDDNTSTKEFRKIILNKPEEFEIVGEITPNHLLLIMENFSPGEGFTPPEMIIAKTSFINAGLIGKIRIKSLWGMQPKIIIIADNEEQVRQAFKQGADWAVTRPFKEQDLINWLRSLSDDVKRLCFEYRNHFSKIRAAASQNNIYNDLVGSTLQLLFHPDLVNPENVRMTSSPSLSSRLIFRNQAREHEFWIDAYDAYKSKYITIDVYNKTLEPSNLETLGKYLSESHGLIGLIVGRQTKPEILRPVSIALLKNEKKVVIPLDDSQLQAMLEYKAGGINPVCLLQDRYQWLIAAAGGEL